MVPIYCTFRFFCSERFLQVWTSHSSIYCFNHGILHNLSSHIFYLFNCRTHFFKTIGFVIIPIATSISSWINVFLHFYFINDRHLYNFDNKFVYNFPRCLLYSSDAADEEDSLDLGAIPIIHYYSCFTNDAMPATSL